MGTLSMVTNYKAPMQFMKSGGNEVISRRKKGEVPVLQPLVTK
jgi:hypothetical protein